MEQEINIKAFETDLRLGLFPSRKLILERNKALSHARNPGLSKYGQCLVRGNDRLNNLLKTNLGNLNAEIKRMELQLTQRKKLFIKTSGLLNHEPLLLVQRPKSEKIVETGRNIPGFMKPRSSKTVRPSSIKTIDIYTVQPPKKKNLWEDPNEEKSMRFTSVIRPCAKLSQNDIESLKNEYSATKPTLSFDSASKGYTIVRSELSPSSAKQKRLSGQITPDSEEAVKDKNEEDSEDDISDDDNDSDFWTDGFSSAGIEKRQTDQSKPDNESTAFISRSSSFITEGAALDKNITITVENTNEQPTTDRTEAEIANASIVTSEDSRSDTRQIPYRLPPVSSQAHPHQDNIDEDKQECFTAEEHPKPEYTRVEQTIQLQTRGNLTNINVVKAGLLGRISNFKNQSLSSKKQAPVKAIKVASAGKSRDSGVVRRASAKSVKFNEIRYF